MITAKNMFQEKGFSVLKNICSHEIIETIYKSVQINIQQCATELQCSIIDYLSNVSRWVHPSPVTNEIYQVAVSTLTESVSNFIEGEVALAKMNVISKSAYADNPVPCHQDIAYSAENPYQFSLWLALSDVDLIDGALEFLPGSHLDKIEPAVDFWQPDFIDKKYLSTHWQQNAIAVPVQTSDAIAFDSRIWHRSAKNVSGHSRFALVTRWSRIDYQPPKDIPAKIPATFGMWTCGKITENLLQQGLRYCFKEDISADLITYLNLWQEKLIQQLKLPFLINFIHAQKALQDVLILHRAAEQHNGGDAQGIVYSNLWHYLLSPLALWLNQLNEIQQVHYYERAI